MLFEYQEHKKDAINRSLQRMYHQAQYLPLAAGEHVEGVLVFVEGEAVGDERGELKLSSAVELERVVPGGGVGTEDAENVQLVADENIALDAQQGIGTDGSGQGNFAATSRE